MQSAISYNRTVYASARKRLGLHSARSPKGSYASFRQIGGGGLASQAIMCRRQLRKQPKRYAPVYNLKGEAFFQIIITGKNSS